MIEKLRKIFNSKIIGADNKELLKGGGFAFFMKVTGIGINYLFVLLLARLYGAGGSGIFSIFQGVFQFFATIGKMGYDILMVREVAQYNAKNQWGSIKKLYFKVIQANIVLSIFCSLVMFFGADWIAVEIFMKPKLSQYFQIGAFGILPFVLHAVHSDCFRGMKKILVFSFLQNVIITAISGILLFASYFIINQEKIPITLYVAAVIISSIVSGWFWWKKSPMRDGVISEKIIFSEKSTIAFSLFLIAILQLIRGWTDIIFIGRYYSEEDVGVYKVAFRIATITSISLTAFLLTVAPKIAELHIQGEIKRLAIVAQNTTKLIFWTSAPILILLFSFPAFFMGIFGRDFIIGATPLMILTIGQFINAATGPIGNLLIMTGNQNANRNIILITTVITIIFNAVVIPEYGIVGASIVNVGGIILYNLIQFIMVKRYLGFYTFVPKYIFNFSKKDFLR